MNRILFAYLFVLAIHYLLNPLVPAPTSIGDRAPQGVFGDTVAPDRPSPLNLDAFGLIVQADGDGGDTAQRTGMFYYVFDDRAGFARALDQLEVQPGIYVRHPLQSGFRADPRHFSRDQQRPIIISLGKYGMKERLWRMAKAHLLRLGKYQNLDFIGPVGLGEYIRSFDAKFLYPLLTITDSFLFLSSLHLIAVASLDPGEVDDNNHVMTLLQARDVMPTFFGWLALEVYKNVRPNNLGNYVLGKKDAVQGALAWYHRVESGGNPYIGDAMYRALAEGGNHNSL